MALARAIPLKDATVTAVSSGANGTAYDLSSVIAAGRKIYAGYHVIAQSTDQLTLFVQSATSSGFTTATTEALWSFRTSRGAEWATTPGSLVGSTDRIFWRQRWTLTTGSNAPTANFLGWVSIQ